MDRNLPSLSWWHILLRWPSAKEAVDEVLGDQDVLGEVEKRPGGDGEGGLGPVQGPGRPGHGLCWYPVSQVQEETKLEYKNSTIM